MINLKVNHCVSADPDNLPIEMVERKGIGHPDTLADAIAERTSVLYSNYFLKEFGVIGHHWFDKVVLDGGAAEISFDHWRQTEPIVAHLFGKAVQNVGSTRIPIEDIFRQAIQDIFSLALPASNNCNQYFRVEIHVGNATGPGQKSFRYKPKNVLELSKFEASQLVSNDCNLCVSFWSLSAAEQLVLDIESELVQSDPGWFGRDIKTIVTRTDDQLNVLVNIPFLSCAIKSKADYLEKRAELEQRLIGFARERYSNRLTLEVNPEWRHDRCYLSGSGSCLDTGDVGVVGRGNRANGLITPMRSMSIEAPAGKNPLDHTGKLLAAFTQSCAQRISKELGINNTLYAFIRKGDPLDCPALVGVLSSDHKINSMISKAAISTIVHESLNSREITEAIIGEKVRLF